MLKVQRRREVALPKDRKLVSQIHSIKRHVLPSGKVSFDAERSTKNGHADKFWAMALPCQQDRRGGRGPWRMSRRGCWDGYEE